MMYPFSSFVRTFFVTFLLPFRRPGAEDDAVAGSVPCGDGADVSSGDASLSGDGEGFADSRPPQKIQIYVLYQYSAQKAIFFFQGYFNEQSKRVRISKRFDTPERFDT